MRKNKTGKYYCSKQCKDSENQLSLSCDYCSTQFTRKKSDIRIDQEHHFCSQKCSNTYLGINSDKAIIRTCKKCQKQYYKTNTHTSPTVCPTCRENSKNHIETIKNLTLKEYKELYNYSHKHQSLIYSTLRQFCRSWNKHLKQIPCQHCGYSKHIEFCHIKSIADFDDNTTLREINSEHNVAILCPNCHWEFDNNIIKLSDFSKNIT